MKLIQKTLYVTDLDGTLLNKKDRINQYSLDVINQLVSKGMLFTYATARSLVSATVVTAGLSNQIPVIAYNGAFIIDPSNNKILASEYFDLEERRKVQSVLQKYNISPLVYAYVNGIEKVSWNTRCENDGIRRYLSLRKGDKRLRPLLGKEGLFDGEPFYYTCIGEQQDLLPIYDIFSNDNRYTCTIQQELYRQEYWCEIMPKNATKANAILKLKKMWNCDNVISFGDAINDIPMFQISNQCYAVANAVDELKSIATGVIDANDRDGVAKWLHANIS